MIALNKLQWSYIGFDEIRNIKGANKTEKYFLDKNLTIPLVFCSGEIVVDYWRKDSNIDQGIINDFFGSSESIEHYNKKIEFFIKKELDLKTYKFVAHSSQVEYRLKEINKIIDVVFFDNENNPLVGIEIFNTNKKTDSDIKKFENINFPIYEYNIKTRECYPISCGCIESDEIKLFREKILKTNNEISRDKIRIEKDKIRLEKGREYVQEQPKRYGFHSSESIEREIKDIENTIEKIESNRRRNDGCKQTFSRLDKEITQVESQIREIERDGQRERERNLREQIKRFEGYISELNKRSYVKPSNKNIKKVSDYVKPNTQNEKEIKEIFKKLYF
mgnify:FL=1|tara:strand:+ start:42 stop:1043 length:1002 start_codon:yes stop_codon:yes gene_type:complete